MEVEAKNEKNKDYLFYDDECPLCLRFKQALERIPGTDTIEMISIHSERIKEFKNISIEECEKEIHMITKDEKILVGAQVPEYLISLFPGVSKFTWLLESDVAQKGLERMYALSNRFRKNWAKNCKAC